MRKESPFEEIFHQVKGLLILKIVVLWTSQRNQEEVIHLWRSQEKIALKLLVFISFIDLWKVDREVQAAKETILFTFMISYI